MSIKDILARGNEDSGSSPYLSKEEKSEWAVSARAFWVVSALREPNPFEQTSFRWILTVRPLDRVGCDRFITFSATYDRDREFANISCAEQGELLANPAMLRCKQGTRNDNAVFYLLEEASADSVAASLGRLLLAFGKSPSATAERNGVENLADLPTEKLLTIICQVRRAILRARSEAADGAT